MKNSETGETLDDLDSEQEGHELRVVFPTVNEKWQVQLTEVDATNSQILRYARAHAFTRRCIMDNARARARTRMS